MTGELDFAVDLAHNAGKLLLGHFSLSGSPAARKKDSSVVTTADIEADQLIRKAILDRYPDDGVLSEEIQTIFPANKRVVWVVDPLDGTTNYSLGLPIWGVSIARLVDGWPETAALYFPILEELYTAQKGAGALCNGIKLAIQSMDQRNTATFFACCSRGHRLYDIQVPYKPRILGSAAFNLCSVARGMAVLSFEAQPKLWDLAAAWLVACEAGAVSKSLDGSRPFPPVPGVDYADFHFPTLTAPTDGYIQKGLKYIRPKPVISEG